MVGIRIHGAADAVDHLKRVHGLTVDESLQVHVVEAVLCLQTLGHALGNGLNDDDRRAHPQPHPEGWELE